MLAADLKGDTSKVQFPVLVSPKIDGIRAVMVDGVAMSRSMKPIPNLYIQKWLKKLLPKGNWDGELVVGSPTAPDCMQATTSGVMRKEGTPDFTYFVFDNADPKTQYWAFFDRARVACEMACDVGRETDGGVISPLWQVTIRNEEELLRQEAGLLEDGYEGVMLRAPGGHYKFGRSTLKEGLMLKLKRFTDGEAEVIGVQELMTNQNEAKTNEVGRTQRSSAKAGLVPGGTMGSLQVKDLKSGVEFSIGSGPDAANRKQIWEQYLLDLKLPVTERLVLGAIAKYKSFKIGEKDKPRFPILLGFRDRRDM